MGLSRKIILKKAYNLPLMDFWRHLPLNRQVCLSVSLSVPVIIREGLLTVPTSFEAIQCRIMQQDMFQVCYHPQGGHNPQDSHHSQVGQNPQDLTVTCHHPQDAHHPQNGHHSQDLIVTISRTVTISRMDTLPWTIPISGTISNPGTVTTP